MFYVYVLISLKDHRLYVGFSSDLERRLQEHLSGHSTATKDRRPLKLIYYEAYQEEAEAKQRERYLKGGNGRAQLKIQLFYTLSKYHYGHL
jgi:putative endonuclease